VKGCLIRNVLTFGEMDPFLDIKLSDLKRSATSVDLNSHFNPKWSDILKFERDP
jgi:hypothetical protein